MRNFTPLTIAATLLLAAPAVAQDNAVTATNDAAAAEVTATDPLDANAAITTAPANDLTADPNAMPMTTEPAAVDPAYAEPVEEEDDDRFPWGLLGLLGLTGLIPRKPAERRHDGAI